MGAASAMLSGQDLVNGRRKLGGAVTGKERIRLAMQLKEPDRVPVMCQMSVGYILLNTKLSPVDWMFTNEKHVEALIELAEKYDFDGVLLLVPGQDPYLRDAVLRVSEDEEEMIVHWKDGGMTVCPWGDSGRDYLPRNQRPPTVGDVSLANMRGLRSIPYYRLHAKVFPQLPLRDDAVGTAEDLPEFVFARIDLALERVGNSLSIHGEVDSPFEVFIFMFGVEDAFLSLVDDPVKCKEILQIYTEGSINWAVAQARRGVDAIKLSSAYAGGSLISREFYREFVLPYEKQVVQAVREVGVPVYLHTCGSIGDRLDLMLETGASGIECLDPPPLGNVELTEAKETLAGKAFIKGNIDSVNTLLSKSREEVSQDARERIEIAGPGGGYILSTACSIAPRVPPENVSVLAQVAKEYGGYPLDK
jgi:uroporphyrinogen-III decarboxylase